MGEKDTERKGRRFWSLDILWLVPWAYLCLALYPVVRENLPLYSLCQSETERWLTHIGRGFLLAIPLVALFLPVSLYRHLMRKGRRRAWRLLGLIAIFFCLLHFSWPTYMDESNEFRASWDCRSFSTAILLFHKDTGEWPYYCSPFDDPDREPCIDYLYGNMGDMPDLYEPAWETWGTVSDDMFFHLVENGRERPYYLPKGTEATTASATRGWKEPYLPYVTDDPWWNKYLVSVGAFEGGRLKGSYVWCISAGANRCLETPTTARETQGDDIGYRTK